MYKYALMSFGKGSALLWATTLYNNIIYYNVDKNEFWKK